MAYEQTLQGPNARFESGAEISLKQKWKSTSASENLNGCFECNICLDSAHDPVVTLCGHLFCWPCIYKWLHVQTSSSSSSSFETDNETPKCPVCKANISQSSLVPLYGRGTSPSESDARKPQTDVIVPRRPKPLGMHHLNSIRSQPQPQPQPQPRQFHQQQYFPNPYGSYASMASSNFGGTAMMVGMFGEMVFARMFGSSDTSLFAYPNSNTYPLTGSGGTSPRLRRQEMELEKSLNRVSIFLFCCFVLCLLLF